MYKRNQTLKRLLYTRCAHASARTNYQWYIIHFFPLFSANDNRLFSFGEFSHRLRRECSMLTEIVFYSVGEICLTNSGCIPANCFMKIANILVNWITNNENMPPIHFSHLGIRHIIIYEWYILPPASAYYCSLLHQHSISLTVSEWMCTAKCVSSVSNSVLFLRCVAPIVCRIASWYGRLRTIDTCHIWLNGAMSGSSTISVQHCTIILNTLRHIFSAFIWISMVSV